MAEKPSHSDAIQAMLNRLGIPVAYTESCGMAYQPDCMDLVETEPDVFGRQPYMDRTAHTAWLAMQKKAGEAGITLQIVSAFRSADYQCGLLQAKLDKGQHISDILKVNAAPGYSEHHSGCALDLTTPGYSPLEEDFENSPAFAWLTQHASEFDFQLSFPRDNTAGICYEPWHWCYRKQIEKN